LPRVLKLMTDLCAQHRQRRVSPRCDPVVTNVRVCVLKLTAQLVGEVRVVVKFVARREVVGVVPGSRLFSRKQVEANLSDLEARIFERGEPLSFYRSNLFAWHLVSLADASGYPS
jgi:hypothetical protein